MWTLSWKIREKGHLLTSDFERNLPAERIHQLSEASGRPYAEIDALLLIHSVRQHTVVLNTAGKIWPWLIPIGICYRNRLIGQPFCPQYFQEGTPHLRREWRMAWAAACNKHRFLLQDCCPECGYFVITVATTCGKIRLSLLFLSYSLQSRRISCVVSGRNAICPHGCSLWIMQSV